MSKKKKNWIGKIFTITGLLLFAAALALSVYNLWDGYRAEQSREKLLEEYRDKNQNISDEGEQAEESDGQIPDYQLNLEMEMPEVMLEELDGAACIGVLEIPEIDLKLTRRIISFNYFRRHSIKSQSSLKKHHLRKCIFLL